MLRWTIAFFLFAVIAAIFGFGGISEDLAGIAKILFFGFLILLAVSVIFGRKKIAA